jgi:hypothetical protein
MILKIGEFFLKIRKINQIYILKKIPNFFVKLMTKFVPKNTDAKVFNCQYCQ